MHPGTPRELPVPEKVAQARCIVIISDPTWCVKSSARLIEAAWASKIDWSNAKSIWANSKPMNDEEPRFKQVQMTTAATAKHPFGSIGAAFTHTLVHERADYPGRPRLQRLAHQVQATDPAVQAPLVSHSKCPTAQTRTMMYSFYPAGCHN